MEAIKYLYKTSFKNQLKKSVKKPVTVIYCILTIAYLVWMYHVFQDIVIKMKIDTPEGLVTVLSVVALFFLPGNLITFAKRKGLIFRKSDVHLLFASPVTPKSILVYAYLKNIIMSIVFGIILIPIGILWFHVPVYKVLLYFLVSSVVENVLEISLMVILYGNESLSKRTLNIFRKVLLLFIVAIGVIGVYLYFDYDKSLAFVGSFLSNPYLQMVPIIGWSIACYRLLFLGATTLNIICTCLYLISAVLLFIIAYRMSCTGLYYQDAMKFADDYEEARKRGQKGEVAIVGGKKAKLKAATIEYKGNYAKAIFYRQILEYKKKRFFIFGAYNLLCLGIGIVIAYLSKDMKVRDYAIFIAAGAGAYCTFIFSGFATKWSKELGKPYTYLIPDSPLKKLWYATVIEHIRAIIDGLLIVLPVAIVTKMNIVAVILSVFCYVCLQANKLYLTVLSEALLGVTVGEVGKQWLRMFGMSICIAAAIFAAVILEKFAGLEVAFLGMIIVEVVITAIIAVAASVLFKKMET
ncbi:putative ABC exporter domain-containing protein [Anaerosporobacter sp.]